MLALRSFVYWYTFFNKIKSNESSFMFQNTVSMTFMVCCAENVFFTWESMHCFFLTCVHGGKPFFKNWNMLLHTHRTFFSKFHKVCTSQLPKIWRETSSVQTWINSHIYIYIYICVCVCVRRKSKTEEKDVWWYVYLPMHLNINLFWRQKYLMKIILVCEINMIDTFW